MNISDISLVSFKAISSFVTDLSGVFGEDQKGLLLYSHLLSKTTLSHEKAISKHYELFKEFCIANRDNIRDNDEELVQTTIEYSEKVKIDFSEIFKQADPDTKKVIWKHVLMISAVVDQTGYAKQILRKSAEVGPDDSSDFLTNIISKIESNVDPNANPMEAISSIMSSGVFTDLITGMGAGLQDGSLDMSKLMGSVQNLMGGIQGGVDGAPGDMSDMMKMMGSMGTPGAAGGAPPDMSDMMKMMGNMGAQDKE